MDQGVYLGLWTNWSRGSVLGLIFTTTRQRGDLLIAFTAFFISFVATRLWKILCLALHRSYSTSEPCDTIHHQQQVILRNSSSPESGMVALLRLLIAYRSSLKGRLLRQLTPVLLAILLLVGFSVAGGFSSSISSSVNDEVLAMSSNCGILGGGSDNATAHALGTAYYLKRLSDATQYARNCYTQNSTVMPECQKYAVDKIATNTTDTSAPCPFQEQICRTKENIRLDTGYISSHDSIGLNAPESERFAWRYVLHCAPLKTDGYTINVTEGNSSWVTYRYGTRFRGSSDDITSSPITYAAHDISEQYANSEYTVLKDKRYIINSQTTYATHRNSTPNGFMQPISELDRLDGDVTIVFLVGNGVLFFEPTDDAWYRATVRDTTIATVQSPGRIQTYRPSEPASPMGCVEQWQWCNLAYPTDQGCGPLASFLDAIYGAAPLFNLTSQDFITDRPMAPTPVGTRLIWPAIVLGSSSPMIWSLLGYLGEEALASQDRLFSGVQWPIPNNQWQQDVTYWWNSLLSLIQVSFVETVYGDTDPQLGPLLGRPLNQEEEKMCQRQKIRSTSYRCFNVFGLNFTYITGSLIVVLSYSLEPIFRCLHRRRKYRQYAHLEWVTNEHLQLHRLAHEPFGDNTWYGCDNEVPTTDPEVHLPALDISNPKHPILYKIREKKPIPRPSLTVIGSSDEDQDGPPLTGDQAPAETSLSVDVVGSEEQHDHSSTEVQLPTEDAWNND
ncbi:hypothetical protein F4782DRAFT_120878 [Xylaria castorea]|nr:hypothetical protein F4782DRAFT_120878 [Xylaria castorea]